MENRYLLKVAGLLKPPNTIPSIMGDKYVKNTAMNNIKQTQFKPIQGSTAPDQRSAKTHVGALPLKLTPPKI